MLTRSTGLVLTNMRSLGVSLPPATVEPSKRGWNLGLLMGSPLHLEPTQLPTCTLVLCSRAGGLRFFRGRYRLYVDFESNFENRLGLPPVAIVPPGSP